MATGTERRASQNKVQGHGFAGTLKNLISTVELVASAASATIVWGRIPSDARICGQSFLYNDDCATTGSPTLDTGFKAVDSNITSDPDALGNGLALSSAGTGTKVVTEIANIGLPAWDFVNGQASDPGGELDVYSTVADASTTTTGTITLELYYYLD